MSHKFINMTDFIKDIEYKQLIEKIGYTYQSAKRKIISAVNTEMLVAYWQIGKDIIEFEQDGFLQAEYGTHLLENLAKELTLLYGKGFSRSNLNYMRLLYMRYPICETLSHKLSWSHYYELLKVDDDLARMFYENQTIAEIGQYGNSGVKRIRVCSTESLLEKIKIKF
ncbi:MAG: DUF1016 N-terminal domain-containing protein [Candidatus Kapaibacterium sp.]